MTRIDFREPSIPQRLAHCIKSLIRSRSPVAYLYALGAVLLIAQATRLAFTLGHLWDSQARRQSIALEVRDVKTRAAASHNLQHLLSRALDLRRTNSQLALQIARIGNALAPDLALTTLRSTDFDEPTQSVELDGRTRNVFDIIKTIRQLSVSGNLEFHRDDQTDGAVSFRLDVNPEDSRLPK